MHNEGHRFKLYASAVWAECLALIHIYQRNSAVELNSVGLAHACPKYMCNSKTIGLCGPSLIVYQCMHKIAI